MIASSGMAVYSSLNSGEPVCRRGRQAEAASDARRGGVLVSAIEVEVMRVSGGSASTVSGDGANRVTGGSIGAKSSPEI